MSTFVLSPDDEVCRTYKLSKINFALVLFDDFMRTMCMRVYQVAFV